MTLSFYDPSFRSALLRYQRDAASTQQAEWAEYYLALLENDPKCFERTNMRGHFTGSAVVVDTVECKVLLTHHAKTRCWLQLGGHCDGLHDPFFVAWKEAYEESGLKLITPVDGAIFDLDPDGVPEYQGLPAHGHYDIRYLFYADSKQGFVKSDESLDLAWVDLDKVDDYTQSKSVLRLAVKALAHIASTYHPQSDAVMEVAPEQREATPFDEGRKAFQNGRKFYDNPYEDKRDRLMWFEGFRSLWLTEAGKVDGE
jgi:hypothetical protein